MIHRGDCLAVMPTLEAESVDAIVCDPPYGFAFMGKAWDRGVPGVPFWEAALRVAKPGAHLVAFGGTRTYHRLTCAIEDAGWEIRDCLSWLYGSGFPKSRDVSKAMDKAVGATRKITRPGVIKRDGYGDDWDTGSSADRPRYDLPATEAARQWDGWGTALKPAWEPIILARKPLVGTVAANVQAHGTGALNIDACRVEGIVPATKQGGWFANGGNYNEPTGSGERRATVFTPNGSGRWPANVCLDPDAAALLDEQSGRLVSGPESDAGHRRNTDSQQKRNTYGGFQGQTVTGVLYGDTGGASRFFYCAKASRAEREAGLEGGERKDKNWSNGDLSPGTFQSEGTDRSSTNHHPTVKPVALMRWLCRLVTPPGGLILDPFMGSGTAGIAAALEGFRFTGIEREAEYMAIAEARIAHARQQPSLWEVT